MAFNDYLKINRNNYSRQNTSVTLQVLGQPLPLTEYISDINYKENFGKTFGTSINTLRASRFGLETITGSGSLVLSDAGLDALNKFATNTLLLPSFLWMGITDEITISVKYLTQTNLVKEDILFEVQFEEYNNGVNDKTSIYDRTVSMKIGKVAIGNIGQENPGNNPLT